MITRCIKWLCGTAGHLLIWIGDEAEKGNYLPAFIVLSICAVIVAIFEVPY